MRSIFFTVNNSLPITVIAEVSHHLNGHPVLTYTYHIFFNSAKNDPSRVLNYEIAIKDKLSNPDYYGYITFEDPNRLFSYTPKGQRELNRDELEEIIERLKHYRKNPSLWHLNN